jgi:spore coat protein U-like protein
MMPHLVRRLGWLLLLSCHVASAATCTVGTVGVAFGSYDPFAIQPLDSVGSITVHCDTSTSYSAALSPGGGSFANRLMQNGAHTLAYNLFIDSNHVTVWGDGSGETSTQSGTSDTPLPVYGRIRAGQNAYVGAYTDTIVVTVTL